MPAPALKDDVRSLIRSVPDFPKPGIVFRDITTLLQSGPALRRVVDWVVDEAREKEAEVLVGIESRGFILAGAAAAELELPLVLARKPGKLPWETVSQTYTLEYGTDALEMHKDAVKAGQRVLVIDDLLATGGTAEATVKLIEQLGGQVVGTTFMVELSFLKGRDKLAGYPIASLVDYESE
jgi:adenine phosphoribosyltransferase